MAAPIAIDDLQGGMADDHAAALKENQVTHAYDVDYWASNCGGRRNGCTNHTTGLASAIIGMFHHTPTSLASGDLLFTATVGGAWRSYTITGTGVDYTPAPADTFTPATGVDAVSLHGKLFLACKNSTGRLHVYDGTTLRRVGFTSTTAAPTAVDTAAAGIYASTRYFRVRWTTQLAGATILRSEASAVLTKAPSGTNTGLVVTRPTAASEGETHWEVEESIDNADFYRIATVAIATTTYEDTLVAADVATTGTLSEDVNDYLPPRSVRWLAVDNDRLVMGGDFETPSLDARIQWTPLSSALGVGNDERIPLDNSNYIDADNRNSGGLTGLKAYEGKLVAFKINQIHVLIRAGTNGSAYLPGSVVRSKGALPYSVVEGFDAEGRSALYFLDPASGPSAMGGAGIVSLAPQLRATWKANINRNATVRVCNAVYYADKQQVWWNISTGSNNTPNQRWVYHTATGGITFHTLPAAVSSCVMWDDDALGSKPTMGLATSILTCDTTATNDAGTNFRAYIRTRAYTVAGLVKQGGVTDGIIEADAASGVTLTLKLIRDYGAETTTVTALLTATGTETIVIVPVDDAFISEAKVVQFEIGDPSAVSVAAWQLHRMVFRLRPEGKT